MLSTTRQLIQRITSRYPGVKKHLGGLALGLAGHPIAGKTFSFYRRELRRMVQNTYDGKQSGAEFSSIMANLVTGQLTQAFEQALSDNDMTPSEMTDDMASVLDNMISNELSRVEGFAREIIDAMLDGKPVDGFLARADVWANRWNDAYNEASHLITLANGGKEEWIQGPTEEGCPTCSALDGIVAFAKEWEEAGVRPQNPPNPALDCDGWECKCRRVPTKKRRSQNALARILDAIVAGSV